MRAVKAEGKIKGDGTRACLEPSATSISGSTGWGRVRAVLKRKALQLLACRCAAYTRLCRHALEHATSAGGVKMARCPVGSAQVSHSMRERVTSQLIGTPDGAGEFEVGRVERNSKVQQKPTNPLQFIANLNPMLTVELHRASKSC